MCLFEGISYVFWGKYCISLRMGDNMNTINQWRGWNDGTVCEARLTAC